MLKRRSGLWCQSLKKVSIRASTPSGAPDSIKGSSVKSGSGFSTTGLNKNQFKNDFNTWAVHLYLAISSKKSSACKLNCISLLFNQCNTKSGFGLQEAMFGTKGISVSAFTEAARWKCNPGVIPEYWQEIIKLNFIELIKMNY